MSVDMEFNPETNQVHFVERRETPAKLVVSIKNGVAEAVLEVSGGPAVPLGRLHLVVRGNMLDLADTQPVFGEWRALMERLAARHVQARHGDTATLTVGE